MHSYVYLRYNTTQLWIMSEFCEKNDVNKSMFFEIELNM